MPTGTMFTKQSYDKNKDKLEADATENSYAQDQCQITYAILDLITYIQIWH